VGVAKVSIRVITFKVSDSASKITYSIDKSHNFYSRNRKWISYPKTLCDPVDLLALPSFLWYDLL